MECTYQGESPRDMILKWEFCSLAQIRKDIYSQGEWNTWKWLRHQRNRNKGWAVNSSSRVSTGPQFLIGNLKFEKVLKMERFSLTHLAVNSDLTRTHLLAKPNLKICEYSHNVLTSRWIVIHVTAEILMIPEGHLDPRGVLSTIK